MTSFSSQDIASLSLTNVDDDDNDANFQAAADTIDWSITFEQFLASVLNESSLVNFFEQKVDVVAK